MCYLITMSFGCIDEFNPREASWKAYIEHLQNYYHANGIGDDARKKAILMSVCGSETFTFLRNLAMPRTTMDLTHAKRLARSGCGAKSNSPASTC